MKVLVVTNMYPSEEQPAFGTFVRDQVEALRGKGIDIDLLFIDGSKGKRRYVGGAFRFWGRLLRRLLSWLFRWAWRGCRLPPKNAVNNAGNTVKNALY